MSLFQEFKKFAIKGNMLDLAIGVIIGSAFTSLVNAIVSDFFTPLIGLLTGGIDFSNMFWQLSGEPKQTLAAAKATGATIAYGNLLTIFINFLITAWILFFFVKALSKIRHKEEADEKNLPVKITKEEALLTEIRDILAKKK
ncbi:large conductance mechanosensitive channel protein MscL [Bartonella sp. DGB1]|uniref:large conductance mechanosensitive channel protein MscL n=1 Tax=Bartonella sp. DGB1 TaxID=3239807 RepID=UPI0035237811